VLTNADDRAALARFIESIDASTEPFPLSAPRTRLTPAVTDGPVKKAVFLASPNPANKGRTTITFTLASPGVALVGIYDPLGRRIATLADGFRPAGRYQVAWDGRSRDGTAAPSGVYFARLEVASTLRTTAFVVTR